MNKNSKESQAAQDIAASYVLRMNKRGKYQNEDDMIEDRRIVEREIYDDMMERRYGRHL